MTATVFASPSLEGQLLALTAGLPDGYGVVLSRRDEAGLRRAGDVLVTADNATDLARYAAEVAQVADVYVSCCAMTVDSFARVCESGRGKRGGTDDMGALVAVWADIDVAGPGHAADNLPPDRDAVRRILAKLPAFTVLIWTGGGFHVWWLLEVPLVFADDPVARQRAAALADGWVRTVAKVARDVGGWTIDAGVGDLARVLRLAGTFNRKTLTPRRVDLVDVGVWPELGIVHGVGWRPGPLYGVDQLEALLDPLAPEVGPRRTPPTRPVVPSARTEARGLLDAVNAAPWSECWPSDWSYMGDESIGGEAVELWRRPGSTSPCSAKCWPDGGCRVWSDQVTGLPAGDYSRADVLAWRLGLSLSELSKLIGREARKLIGARR